MDGIEEERVLGLARGVDEGVMGWMMCGWDGRMTGWWEVLEYSLVEDGTVLYCTRTVWDCPGLYFVL